MAHLRAALINILVLLLVFGQLVFSFVDIKVSAESKEKQSTQTENDFIDLGTPIQTAQTIDAVYGQENGTNVVYTTVTGSASSGDWAKFNVIDIDNEKLLGSYPLDGASNSWTHVITPDGRVFIGASKKMFVYDPVKRSY
ncbi:hypothetical protein NX021_23410 [Cytobacillus firmus]|nr:hypothetical protein [Cytobacillus firmus]